MVTRKFIITILTLFFTQLAAANTAKNLDSNFLVETPRQWVLDDDTEPGISIYKNSAKGSYERITLQVLDRKGTSLKFASELTKHLRQISELREAYFAQFGLVSYNILAIDQKPNPFLNVAAQRQPGSGKMSILQARFRDFQNVETQTLERQYQRGDKLLIVTYILKAPALNDPERAERILNAFIPNYKSNRAPASELVTASAAVRPGEDVSTAVPDIENLDMDNPAVQKMCADVPADQRRTKSDLGFSYALPSFLKNSWGCMSGVGSNLWSIVKGVGSLTVAAAKYLNPFSNEYADQVTASLGVVGSEIKNNPTAFVRRLGTQIYLSASKEMRELPCYKPAIQWQKICSIASNLIPAGLVIKVAARVPLVASESAKLNAAIRDGLGAKKVAAVAAKTGVEAQDVVHTIPPGSSVPSLPQVPKAIASVIFKNYADQLKPLSVAGRNRIASLIESLEKRGISREKIQETLRSVQPLCAVH